MSSSRQVVALGSSHTVRFNHPTDVVSVPKNPLDNTGDSSTCSFKAYDPGKDEALSAAEASGQTVLSVTNAAVFKIGDVTEVTLDDGTLHDFTLSGVDPTTGEVMGSPSLASGAAAGNNIRVRLGPEVTMDEYGTPKLGTQNWGFEGSLASDHPGLVANLDVNVEILFIGDPGNPGSLDVLDVQCLIIKRKEDCADSV